MSIETRTVFAALLQIAGYFLPWAIAGIAIASASAPMGRWLHKRRIRNRRTR